jgi:FkbM family methyltransferase
MLYNWEIALRAISSLIFVSPFVSSAALQQHSNGAPLKKLSSYIDSPLANEEPAPPLAPPVSERSVNTFIDQKNYVIASDDNYLDCIEGRFEPDMVKLFGTLVNPADTVFDIGANIGCTSILFSNKASKVYSFEPSPTTFHYLEKNTRAANLDNVNRVNRGLGKSAGSFELTFSKDNRSGGFVSNKISASEGHQVEKITIIRGDDFVRDNAVDRIDFIKIDVEGFERDVIEGLSATLARDQPAVTLELNHWCLNAFQRMSVPDFFDFLRDVFPYLYAVEKDDIRNLHDQNDAYHVMYCHIVDGFKYPNLVGAFNRQQLARFADTYGLAIA